jgi:hypothetical protein
LPSAFIRDFLPRMANRLEDAIEQAIASAAANLSKEIGTAVREAIAAEISGTPMRRGPGRPPAPVRGNKLRGRKLDMSCRYPGCKNRSKGPRFRFLCEEHLKLPKAQQNAALAKAAKAT